MRQPARLLDVRELWEFETARIEGAKLIPVGEIPSRAHQELDPDDHIVVYCHHGIRSLSGAALLERAGVGPTASLAGGIDAWSRLIDPKVPRY